MNLAHRWYCRSDRWRASVAALTGWVCEGLDPLGDRVLEIGPGYGAATRLLAARSTRITTAETDPAMAAALRRRLPDAALEIVRADAANLPFASRTFSAVLAFAVLHHIRTPDLQDRTFREAARVLAPGGVFAGYDVQASFALKLFHFRDTFVPVAVDALPRRLSAAGFREISVEAGAGGFRFRATT